MFYNNKKVVTKQYFALRPQYGDRAHHNMSSVQVVEIMLIKHYSTSITSIRVIQ
jgi:hypothetical protein